MLADNKRPNAGKAHGRMPQVWDKQTIGKVIIQEKEVEK